MFAFKPCLYIYETWSCSLATNGSKGQQKSNTLSQAAAETASDKAVKHITGQQLEKNDFFGTGTESLYLWIFLPNVVNEDLGFSNLLQAQLLLLFFFMSGCRVLRTCISICFGCHELKFWDFNLYIGCRTWWVNCSLFLWKETYRFKSHLWSLKF